MLLVILALIFALIITLFASQNDARVDIQFASYAIQNIPVYLVMLASALTGMILSWIISLTGLVSSKIDVLSRNWTIRGNEKEITRLQAQLDELPKRKKRTPTKKKSK